MPSTTAPGHGQKPQPLLRHSSPHAFPSSSKAMVFPRTAGKGERRRCSACTSLLANGNSGSGPHLGFPRLVQPSEKLAMVLLPFARGLDGDGSPGKGSASRCSRCHAASGSVPQRIASGYRGEPACSRQPPASGGRWRHSSHHFPISEQIYEPPKSSPAALQEGWGWGLAGGGELFAGNCESTFLHGCVPLCNGNPLSRVKRRPSYHDLLCRFPWIPCTINKKRNFKPVFNPA